MEVSAASSSVRVMSSVPVASLVDDGEAIRLHNLGEGSCSSASYGNLSCASLELLC
jgi:hypothetical protein